jgi:hypothetical protein
MSRIAGYVLIAAGLGGAIYLTPAKETARVFPSTVVDATADARPVAATAAANREGNGRLVFSASHPLVPSDPEVVVVPSTAGPVRTVASALPSPVRTVSPTLETQQVGSDPYQRLASSAPGDPDARWALVRDLQRELKRVGCYEGEVTGAWSPSTRRAMKSFTEWVNASLPVEEPDYILLTLVQNQKGTACSRTCPAGQKTAEDGRCLPNAVIAHAVPARPAKTERKRGGERDVAAAPVLQRVTPNAAGWAAKVTATPADTPVATARAEPREPLEGRMSIGAASREEPMRGSVSGQAAAGPAPAAGLSSREPRAVRAATPPPRKTARAAGPARRGKFGPWIFSRLGTPN